MKNAPWTPAVLAMLIGSTACADGDRSQPGLDADEPTVRIEEELRIGSVSDPDAGFAEIGGISVAPDGRMFVMETLDRAIRVYAPDGRLLRAFGGPGQGPGEFRYMNDLGLLGDTLWVSDIRQRRLTLFSLDGDVIATIPAQGVEFTPLANVTVRVYPSRPRSDGYFASKYQAIVSLPRPTEPYQFPSLTFDAAGAVVDTTGYDQIDPDPIPYTYSTDPEFRFVSPFIDVDLRLIDGTDTIVIHRPMPTSSSDGSFEVTRIGQSGDTIFRRTFGYVPRPVTAEDRDRLVRASIADRLPFMANHIPASDTSDVRRAVQAAMPPAEYLPPVSYAVVRRDGSIWMRREDDSPDSWRWTVLSPDGTSRGTFALPKRATVHWTDGERIWVVELDDLDVPWVVRYRLVEG